MNNYVIIDADKLKLRIEELEKANEIFKHAKTHNPTMAACEAILSTLKQILSQSTPLNPEIEKAWLDGNTSSTKDYKEDYIENLKLDI